LTFLQESCQRKATHEARIEFNRKLDFAKAKMEDERQEMVEDLRKIR